LFQPALLAVRDAMGFYVVDQATAAGKGVGDAAGAVGQSVCDCGNGFKRAIEATFLAGAEDTATFLHLDDVEHGADEAKKKAVEAAEAAKKQMEIALPAIILIVWATSSIALTYFSKWVLAAEDDEKHPGAGFTFPVFYTFVTTFAILCGCSLILLLQKKTNTIGYEQFKQSWKGIVAVALLSIITIWASDASLMYIGVTLNQLLKACMPAPTMAFGFVFENKRFAWPMVAAVMLIVTGALMSIPFADASGESYGIIMACVSTLAASAGISVKARLMADSATNGLTPLVLLFYSAASSVPVLLLWFLCIDERSEVGAYAGTHASTLVSVLLISSGLAFLVQLLGNTLTKVTSALTMTVAGAAKQIGVIVVTGVFIEHTFTEILNVIGVIIFISAVVLYAYLSFNKNTAPKTLPFKQFGNAVKTSVANAAAGTQDLAKKVTEATPLTAKK